MSDDAGSSHSDRRMATRVHRGLAWIGIASSLVGVLDIVALVLILRNWVTQTEYGIVAYAAWAYPLLDQAADLGLSAAMIQRDDTDPAKVSTVFWLNLMVSSALFLGLIAISPLVAMTQYPVVAALLVVYGTKLLIQNAYVIPTALMKRELRFKELSIVRLIANVAEFAGKIGFAWAGFGLWCFVLGPLCRVVVTAIGCQICQPWRPRWAFRRDDARAYLRFGVRSSGSQMLYQFYTNIDYPIVGAFFGEASLGVYKLAYEIVLEPVRIISNIVVDIALPTFARLRLYRDRLIAQLVSFLRLNLITVMTYAAVVFVAAVAIVEVVGPKQGWRGVVVWWWPLVVVPEVEVVPWTVDQAARILCAVAVLRSVSYVIPPLLDGMGYPHRTFNYSLAASIVLPLSYLAGALLLGDSIGLLSVAVAWAVGYPLAFAFLMWIAVSTLEWSLGALLRSIAGVAGCIVVAGLVGWAAHLAVAGLPAFAQLVIDAVVIVATAALLLAYTQGLTLRGAARALRGD